MDEKIAVLIERLEREKGEILILSHEAPDGDSMGSGLALLHFLRKKGKKAQFLLIDGVPYMYNFLPGAGEVITSYSGMANLAVLVDASRVERSGLEKPYPFREIIRIDHHLVGEDYSEYDILDPEAPSTGNIIYDLLKAWDRDAIDELIATCLYTAVLTDTGSFRYSNANEKAFIDAAELVELGADPSKVSRMVYMRKHLTTYRLLLRVLSSLKLDFDGLVAYITVLNRDLEETGASRIEAESFVSYPLSLEGVEIGLKFEEEDGDIWRISFRGKGKVDLSKVALELGGGGHFNASGARIKGDMDGVRERVLDVLRKHMELAGLFREKR